MKLSNKCVTEDESGRGAKPELAVTYNGVPAVTCLTLTGIAAPLLKQLTALMTAMQNADEEVKRLRNQVAQLSDVSREQEGAHKTKRVLQSAKSAATPSKEELRELGAPPPPPPPTAK